MTAIDLIDRRQFYIDGAWAPPVEQHDALVIDPSTEQACAVISVSYTHLTLPTNREV